jgi:hypothetical protein
VVRRLGWSKTVEWCAEDSASRPDFGGVSRDGYEIFLCRDGQASRGRGTNVQTGAPGVDQRADKGAWASIWVDDSTRFTSGASPSDWRSRIPQPTSRGASARCMCAHPDGHVFRIGGARAATD